MSFAPLSEVSLVAATLNHTFAAAPVSPGCKIELGLQLILTGLGELPRRQRTATLASVLGHLSGKVRRMAASVCAALAPPAETTLVPPSLLLH